MKRRWNIATIFKIGLIVMAAIFSSACSSLYFYPMKELVRTPSDIGLDYETITITTRDHVKLHTWLIKAKNPRGVVLFLHGNAENISTHIGSVYWLPEQGFDVLLLDYRGYGGSEGDADFPEVYQDVAAAYDWTTHYAQEKQLPLFILGQSLGAAISSYYFSTIPPEQRTFNAVALDAVFSGHRDIAKDVASRSFITWPFQFLIVHLVPTDFDPKAHIAQLAPTPLLFFHSPEDQVIPFEQGQIVFQQAQEPKTWITTRGPHIATFNFAENRDRLLQFFDQHGALNRTSHPQTD